MHQMYGRDEAFYEQPLYVTVLPLLVLKSDDLGSVQNIGHIVVWFINTYLTYMQLAECVYNIYIHLQAYYFNV